MGLRKVVIKVFTMTEEHSCVVAPSNNQCVVYTAVSRKVVGKNVHATIPKGNMGYNQYTVSDTVAFERTFVALF